MNNIYSFDGVIPVVDESAWVDPTAVLIGDVIVGKGCYVGPQAVLRGDFGRLILEAGSNLQDNCVVHSFPETDTVVEVDGHIGHGAVLHGCHVGRNAMVGMNAVVMDAAVIGEESIIAALAFVKANMQIPPRVLVAGVPGKIVRDLTEQEVAWKTAGTRVYQELVDRNKRSLRQVPPLREVGPNRPRVSNVEGVTPLYELKRATT